MKTKQIFDKDINTPFVSSLLPHQQSTFFYLVGGGWGSQFLSPFSYSDLFLDLPALGFHVRLMWSECYIVVVVPVTNHNQLLLATSNQPIITNHRCSWFNKPIKSELWSFSNRVSKLVIRRFTFQPESMQHTDEEAIFFFCVILSLVGSVLDSELMKRSSISSNLKSRKLKIRMKRWWWRRTLASSAFLMLIFLWIRVSPLSIWDMILSISCNSLHRSQKTAEYSITSAGDFPSTWININ